MLTSPGWYVAVCCLPTLLYDLCAVFVIVVWLAPAASILEALGTITTIATVALLGFGLWHFGIFIGMGIIALWILCGLPANRCIWKCLDGIVKRRIAGFRQRVIHAILLTAGVVEIGEMAEIVDELDTYDNVALRALADDIVNATDPEHTLFASITAHRLEQMVYEADDSAVLAKLGTQQLSGPRKWLLVNVGTLDGDGREISSRMRPGTGKRAKTRRRRKAKSKATAKRAQRPFHPAADRQ